MSEKGALKNKKIEVIALVNISYTRNIYRKML